MKGVLRIVCSAAVELIKSFESLHDGDLSTPMLDPKLCPSQRWTVGWGHALTDATGRQFVGRGARAAAMAEYFRRWPDGMYQADADALLAADLSIRADAVGRLVSAPVSDNQFGALVSFAYNLGVGALQQSTLLRLLNARRDAVLTADEFLKWDKARTTPGGPLVSLPGLARRRRAERALFLQYY